MPEEKQVSFEVSLKDARIISKIAARAVLLASQNDIRYDKQDAEMDITAAHANGCPLELQKLLDSDIANFVHDVFGIRRFLNRSTGELGGCFVPRCAASEPALR